MRPGTPSTAAQCARLPAHVKFATALSATAPGAKTKRHASSADSTKRISGDCRSTSRSHRHCARSPPARIARARARSRESASYPHARRVENARAAIGARLHGFAPRACWYQYVGIGPSDRHAGREALKQCLMSHHFLGAKRVSAARCTKTSAPRLVAMTVSKSAASNFRATLTNLGQRLRGSRFRACSTRALKRARCAASRPSEVEPSTRGRARSRILLSATRSCNQIGGSEAAKVAKTTSLEALSSERSTKARKALRLNRKIAHRMQQAHARAVVEHHFRRGMSASRTTAARPQGPRLPADPKP